LKESPAFRKLLADRWELLKAGPLAEHALLEKFDALVAQNMPYLVFEQARWPQFALKHSLEEVVVMTRERLKARYSEMDSIVREVTSTPIAAQ
jgi:hypothetical protein